MHQNKLSLDHDLAKVLKGIQDCMKQVSRTICNAQLNYSQFEDIVEDCQQIFAKQLNTIESVALAYFTKTKQIMLMNHNIAGKYLVVINPLDVNFMWDLLNCGSIFLIFQKQSNNYKSVSKQDLLQSADKALAFGYCFYGSSV